MPNAIDYIRNPYDVNVPAVRDYIDPATLPVYDVRAFGAVEGDNAANGATNFAAFNRAIKAAEPAVDAAGGGRVFVPEGIWHFSDHLVLARQIVLEGAAGAARYIPGSRPGTILKFPASRGVVVGFFGKVGVPSDGRGDYSVIRDLAIVSTVPAAQQNFPGIRMDSRARVENCFISGFYDGIQINSDQYGTNSNNWFILNCRIEGCQRDGLFVKGNDSNAGTAIMLDCSQNGRWGICDDSFLGNTYVQCHAQGNANYEVNTDPALPAISRGGAFYSGSGTNRSLFDNCYSEQGESVQRTNDAAKTFVAFTFPKLQRISVFGDQTVIVGGTHGAGLSGGAQFFAGIGNKELALNEADDYKILSKMRETQVGTLLPDPPAKIAEAKTYQTRADERYTNYLISIRGVGEPGQQACLFSVKADGAIRSGKFGKPQIPNLNTPANLKGESHTFLQVNGAIATKVSPMDATINPLTPPNANPNYYVPTGNDSVLIINAGAGQPQADFTIQLPRASSCPGRTHTIKKGDTSTKKVIVRYDPQTADTIDSATSKDLTVQHQWITVVSDGVNRWLITSKG